MERLPKPRAQDLRERLLQKWVIAGSDLQKYDEMVTQKLKENRPKYTQPSRLDGLGREEFIKELFAPDGNTTAEDIIQRGKKRSQRVLENQGKQVEVETKKPQDVSSLPNESNGKKNSQVTKYRSETEEAAEVQRQWQEFSVGFEAELDEVSRKIELLKSMGIE